MFLAAYQIFGNVVGIFILYVIHMMASQEVRETDDEYKAKILLGDYTAIIKVRSMLDKIYRKENINWFEQKLAENFQGYDDFLTQEQNARSKQSDYETSFLFIDWEFDFKPEKAKRSLQPFKP